MVAAVPTPEGNTGEAAENIREELAEARKQVAQLQQHVNALSHRNESLRKRAERHPGQVDRAVQDALRQHDAPPTGGHSLKLKVKGTIPDSVRVLFYGNIK